MLNYFLAWFGMMVLAIANGALRDLAYGPRIGDLPAHQISTQTLIIALAGYTWLLNRVWPIRSARQAWAIGLMWFVMTEAFEIGMGFLTGVSWDRQIQAHNLFAGQVWLLIPLWVLVAPYVFFRYSIHRRHPPSI